jgi:hypothetical protein
MARGCRQELCEFWNGSTCVCAAMEGDPDAIEDLEDWVNDQPL